MAGIRCRYGIYSDNFISYYSPARRRRIRRGRTHCRLRGGQESLDVARHPSRPTLPLDRARQARKNAGSIRRASPRYPLYAPSRARPEPVRLKCRPPLATRFASSRFLTSIINRFFVNYKTYRPIFIRVELYLLEHRNREITQAISRHGYAHVEDRRHNKIASVE